MFSDKWLLRCIPTWGTFENAKLCGKFHYREIRKYKLTKERMKNDIEQANGQIKRRKLHACRQKCLRFKWLLPPCFCSVSIHAVIVTTWGPMTSLSQKTSTIYFKTIMNEWMNVTVRTSCDTSVNMFGHKLISLCKELGLCLANGRLEPGRFTFQSSTGCSLVDYFMSRDVRKPVFGVSDQVRHKLGCAVTEDIRGLNFCI